MTHPRQLSFITIAAMVWSQQLQGSSAFSCFSPIPPPQTTHPSPSRWFSSSSSSSSLLRLTRDEYLQPHFETTPREYNTMFDYDRLVECAYGDDSSCPVEEMERMMQELHKMELDSSKVGYGAFLTVESQEDAVANALLAQALEIQVEDARSHHEEQEESTTGVSQQYTSTEDIQHLIDQMRDIAEHEEH